MDLGSAAGLLALAHALVGIALGIHRRGGDPGEVTPELRAAWADPVVRAAHV